MAIFLQEMKDLITRDEIEQALVHGGITPEISRKVYEHFRDYGQQFIYPIYDAAAEWILQDLGWDWDEIQRVGVGSPEAWVDMMTQITDTAIHNIAVEFDQNYRFRNVDAHEISQLLKDSVCLNAVQMKQVLNQYVTQRDVIGKTKAKKNARYMIFDKMKERAETIAIDTLGNSYMNVEYELVDWAMQSGAMSPLSMKRWDTAKDGHVCGICRQLEELGMIPFNEDFVIDGFRLTGRSGAHSRCRCAVVYIDYELIQAGIIEDYINEQYQETADF